mgnify:CR=1 FL=1
MKKRLVLLQAMLILGLAGSCRQPGLAEIDEALPAVHSFELGDRDFLLDGKPFQII